METSGNIVININQENFVINRNTNMEMTHK